MRAILIVIVSTIMIIGENKSQARYFNDMYLLDIVKDGEQEAANPSSQAAESPILLSRVQKSTVSDIMGCKKVPPMNTFKKLNKVCEDCFQLFRDQELYHLCRSDCFGSDYFIGCMDYLIYAKDHIGKMAKLVNGIHEYVR